jgi:hypothetical protein
MDLKIPTKLYREIESFCAANQIDNITEFILKTLKNGFNLEKWGDINYKEVEEIKPPEPIKQPVKEIPPEPIVKPPEITKETFPEPVIKPKLTTETIKPPKPLGNIIEKIRPRVVERTKNNDIYNED